MNEQILNKKVTNPDGTISYVSGATPQDVNQAITAASLAPQKPINVPPSPAPTYTDIGGTNAVIGANEKLFPTTTATGGSDLLISKWLEQSGKDQATRGTAVDNLSTLESVMGLGAKEQNVNAAAADEQSAREKYGALNAQLQQYIYNANTLIPAAQQQAAEGRGITAAGLAPIQAAELRKNALAAAPIQFQALIAQSELANAQGRTTLAQNILSQAENHLAKIFQVQQTDSTNEYNYRKDLRDKVFEFATAAEKAKLDKLQKEDDRKFTLLQDSINNAQDLAKTAIANGQADIAAKITALDPNSKTYIQDLTTLQGQIKPKAQRALGGGVSSDGGGPTTLTGELKTQYGSIVDATANLVGAQRGSTTRKAMSQAISSGDYVSAFAQVANNVEESLTGTPKITFADARTDYSVMSGMRDAIQKYADGGGDMGLLRGTEESIKRKLGIDSGKASALAVQLWREFQTYRVNMTGAAFSPAESRDYAAVNPTLGKSLDLNLSVIDGALNQLENRVLSTIETRVPGAKKLYQKVSNAADGLSDDDAYQEYLNSQK